MAYGHVALGRNADQYPPLRNLVAWGRILRSVLSTLCILGYGGAMSQFRANIETLEAYVPGEQPKPGVDIIKLNTNENPYPPSPRVAEAIRGELGTDGARLRLYSDPEALLLRQAAARRFRVQVDQVLHGNGSDELLALLFRAFIDPGDTVAYPFPTYVLYETLAKAQGAAIEMHDFDRDYTLPKSLFATKAKLVFLANPNSPSGTATPRDVIVELATALAPRILVVDEAYAEFADETALDAIHQIDNLVVLRTFSKSDSLAGMRVGLLFANPTIVWGLRKVKDSYNLDRLAIVAAAAALDDAAWTRENVRRIQHTRQRVLQGLSARGYEVLPSRANFFLVRMGSKASAVAAFEHLRQSGILVRYFALPQLEDALRITVGTDPEMDALLAALDGLQTS